MGTIVIQILLLVGAPTAIYVAYRAGLANGITRGREIAAHQFYWACRRKGIFF